MQTLFRKLLLLGLVYIVTSLRADTSPPPITMPVLFASNGNPLQGPYAYRNMHWAPVWYSGDLNMYWLQYSAYVYHGLDQRILDANDRFSGAGVVNPYLGMEKWLKFRCGGYFLASNDTHLFPDNIDGKPVTDFFAQVRRTDGASTDSQTFTSFWKTVSGQPQNLLQLTGSYAWNTGPGAWVDTTQSSNSLGILYDAPPPGESQVPMYSGALIQRDPTVAQEIQSILTQFDYSTWKAAAMSRNMYVRPVGTGSSMYFVDATSHTLYVSQNRVLTTDTFGTTQLTNLVQLSRDNLIPTSDYRTDEIPDELLFIDTYDGTEAGPRAAINIQGYMFWKGIFYSMADLNFGGIAAGVRAFMMNPDQYSQYISSGKQSISGTVQTSCFLDGILYTGGNLTRSGNFAVYGAVCARPEAYIQTLPDIYYNSRLKTGLTLPPMPDASSHSTIPIATGAGFHSHLHTVPDDAGGMFLSWEDTRDGSSDIYMQHLNSMAQPQWGANGLSICTAANDQTSPQVSADGSGGAFVSWQDQRDGNSHIFAQHVTGDGAIASGWCQDGVQITTTTAEHTNPQIAPDNAGGAFIVWQDYTEGAASQLRALRLTTAGLPADDWTSEGVALTQVCSLDERVSQVAADGFGGVFAVYEWAGMNILFVQHLTGSGIIASGWPGCGVEFGGNDGKLAGDGAGGVFVAYSYVAYDASYTDVRAYHIPSDPYYLWDYFSQLNYMINASPYVSIAADPAGGAFATWTYASEELPSPITIGPSPAAAQHLNESTAAYDWDRNGTRVSTLGHWQYKPRIISDGNGGALVAWTEYDYHQPYRVRAQRLTSGGQIAAGWASEGAAVCPDAGVFADLAEQEDLLPTPWIVPDGNGGAVVAWQDTRFGVQIYAAHVAFNGVVPVHLSAMELE